MLLGILLLSVFAGAAAAVAALVTGCSILAALGLYAGAGVLAALASVAWVAVRSAPRGMLPGIAGLSF